MADLRLRHPLEDIALPGTYGAEGADAPGVILTDRRGLALCQLMARRDQAKALAERLGIGADPGRASTAENFTALPLSSGQWMLVAEAGRDGAFTGGIAERAGDLGHASEQSHGRTAIRLAGPCARDVLAKACRLDLHRSVHQPGMCAQTPIAQIGVLLHQVDATPAYDLIVFAGFARHFWEWLTEAAAEFGYRVEIAEPGA